MKRPVLVPSAGYPMSPMTKKERFANALARRPVDRVPAQD